jgi:hypothetical protein
MQDTELFLSLAEIAGVFVGFGALIAVRSGSTSDVFGVMGIIMVVWGAIQVVIAALIPIVLSRLGVTGHALWVVCSLVALALWWPADLVIARLSPERMEYMAARPLKARWRQELVVAPVWVLMNIALIVVVLGLLPEQEAALYIAAVVLLLLMDAIMLLVVVLRPPVAVNAPMSPS